MLLSLMCQALRAVELELPPQELKEEFDILFNAQSLLFLAELVSTFEEEVEQVSSHKMIVSFSILKL